MTNAPEHDALPDDRRKMILEYLAERGSVRVAELSKQLRVTPVTIRRDLNLLERRGLVNRIHGGVTLRTQTPPALQRETPPNSPAPRPASTPELVIGMVVPSLDYYWPSVARGAKERAAKRNMRILLRKSSYYSPEEDRKQVELLVDEAKVDGLLLTINTGDDASLDLLQWVTSRNIPVVLVERQAELPFVGAPFESVTSDHVSGAFMAVKTLLDMGHKKIAFISSRESPTGPHLLQGWEKACERFGVHAEDTLVASISNETPDILAVAIQEVLDQFQDNQVTAAMVHADSEANALVQIAQQRGLRVPGDLSVIAYDDELASLFTPALTAVRPPRVSIGETALELIAARLEDPERPLHRVILSPRLRIRESTSAPATKA